MPTSGRFLTDLEQLYRPYYVTNLILSLSFVFLKLTKPFCHWLFQPMTPTDSPCDLDMRENEILFFLLIVIMIRARKTGSMNMVCKLIHPAGSNHYFRTFPSVHPNSNYRETNVALK